MLLLYGIVGRGEVLVCTGCVEGGIEGEWVYFGGLCWIFFCVSVMELLPPFTLVNA